MSLNHCYEHCNEIEFIGSYVIIINIYNKLFPVLVKISQYTDISCETRHHFS